jgi:hypothetical protein
VNIVRTQKNHKIKRNHFLDVVSHIKTKKESTKFLLGAGFGTMNCGTNYTRTYTDTLGQPNQYHRSATSSQRFNSLRLIIGMKKNAFNASIISYASSGNNGETGNPAVWLEAKFGYTLSLKNKKI